jgi:hypothetical protein
MSIHKLFQSPNIERVAGAFVITGVLALAAGALGHAEVVILVFDIHALRELWSWIARG